MTAETLTREQILALPPGLDLDRLVAERFFGCKVVPGDAPGLLRCGCPGLPHAAYNPEVTLPDLAEYSSPHFWDGAGAVLEKLSRKEACALGHCPPWDRWGRPACWYVGYQSGDEFDVVAFGETPQLTLCRAALLSML